MNEAWLVIPNPIKHRQVAKVQAHMHYEENKKQAQELGFEFISQLVDSDIPDDLWVCDMACNSSIDATQPINLSCTIDDIDEVKREAKAGQQISGGYAMCGSCFQEMKNNYPEYFERKVICGCCRTEQDTESEVML